jgi:3-hydroxyacyl-CoA dehydrogenase
MDPESARAISKGTRMPSSSSAASAAVRTQRQGALLVATVSNPPVNALSADVRRGLLQAVEAAEADPEVRALVLAGEGRGFIAGADIREFGKPALPPSLPEVCNRIEACGKPVIAALHGPALGGGLEVAMAAHFRIALADAKLGLPEVQLGLMPGSGGTQRAPRLMGLKPALDLMLTGRHIGAQEALEAGLVDRIAEGSEAEAAGVAYAQYLLASRAAIRRAGDSPLAADIEAARATLKEIAADTAKKSRGLFSPLKIVEAVEAGLDLPFAEALWNERRLFLQCIDSPQRAGLVHAFFAEREVVKAPETRAAKPRQVASVGVIGGGTMGAGIAVAVLDAGLSVTMVERDEPSLARGRANVEKVYDGPGAEGRMTAEARAAVLARFAAAPATRPVRCGPRDRSRVRGHRGQEGRLRRTGSRVQARAPCSPPTPPTSTSTASRPASRVRRT